MKCEEFLRLLDDDADVARGEAGDHFAACPSCRRAFARWLEVSGELRAMHSDEAPPFLHTRIMAHVNEAARAPERRAWWTRRPVWAMPALVVSLIIAAGGYGLFEVIRPHLEPVATIGDADRRGTASGFETKEGVRERTPDAMPAPVRRQEAPPAASTPSGARVRRDGPPRAAKEENAAARRAEQRAAPMSFSKDDETPPVRSDERARDAVASSLPAPAPPEERAAGSGALGRLAASSQKAAAPLPERAADVACLLTPHAGGPPIRAYLDAAAAPPPGMNWQVLVSQAGAVAVVTRKGVPAPATASAITRSLASLHVPAGRYTLERALVQ